MIAMAGLLAGCADPEKPEKKPVEPPKIVGRIASIPADRKFVLIQAYGRWSVANGTILITRGTEGRSANLRVTGETLGQYAAADLQGGTVEVGDAVLTRPEIKAEPDAAAPAVSPSPEVPSPSAPAEPVGAQPSPVPGAEG